MILNIFLTLIFICLAVWFADYAESKIDSPKEARFLRPLQDFIKLIFKRPIVAEKASKKLFFAMPIVIMTLTVSICSTLPIFEKSAIADLNLGVLYIISLLLLFGYSLIITGWAPNSHYTLLGSFRLINQLLVYTLIFSLILASLALSSSSLNIKDIVLAQQSPFVIVGMLKSKKG